MLATPAPPPPTRRRHRGLIAGAAGFFAVLLILGGAAVAATHWSHASLSTDDTALAQLTAPKFGATVDSVRGYDAQGHTVAIVNRGGKLYPAKKLRTNERITVEVTTRRPGWSSWALGDTQTTKLTLRTPAAKVVDRWPTVKPGHPVNVTFDAPVQNVALSTGGKDRRLTLLKGQTSIDLGPQAAAGSVSIAAAPRSWERLAKATTVTWFPAGSKAAAIVSPKPGSTFTPTTAIDVTYSHAPKAMPTLSVDGHGTWKHVNHHTIEYRPRGAGFGLGTHVQLTLPAGTRLATEDSSGAQVAAWTVPPGSVTRLQQILADLGYLPLTWKADGAPVAKTTEAQERAAVVAPAGSYAWRWDVPSALKALWTPGSTNTVTQGALMAFENDHGMTTDGLAGPAVWQALLAAEVAGDANKAGYSYVLVQRAVPQSLTLYHDGKTLLTTPANTGVPSAPTELGTFPVYERLATQTMSGTNPDGSHYSDPGIKWISYFNGGDAIHGFDRGSYGTPQSVGCVELPIPTAEQVWPHTPIGTLVTIAD